MLSARMLGLVSVAALALLGQGCHITFDVHSSGQAQVQGNQLLSNLQPLGGLSGQLGTFDITQSQDFKNQNISKSHIQSVKLKTLVLTISNPAGEKFDFLQDIVFQAGTQGQPTVTIAHKKPVPTGVNTFSMDVDDVELVDYVAASSMTVTANASASPPPQDTTIDIAADFIVVAKL